MKPGLLAHRFASRVAAGEALAEDLKRRFAHQQAVVLALPRGGVPVAAPVARTLEVPLDVILARKAGATGNPELGIGAVAEGGVRYLDGYLTRTLGMTSGDVDRSLALADRQLADQVDEYRSRHTAVPLSGRTAIIIDDGLATGSTAIVAAEAARVRGASRVVLAVPVASREAAARLEAYADEVVALQTPEYFRSVGEWYSEFSPVPSAAVHSLLAQTAALGANRLDGYMGLGNGIPEGAAETWREAVKIDAGVELEGDLSVPGDPRGIVVFAHGSGSSRFSRRNQQVAGRLQHSGVATLLLDLLAAGEEQDRRKVFDIDLLSSRLGAAVDWCQSRGEVAALPVGLFGASTGAAAALVSASRSSQVRAVVSRGGRPDLAGRALLSVKVPVLLIVGGADAEVLQLNREAQEVLSGVSELAVVPGAGHLFEEPGALERVADLSADWFARYLGRGHP